MQGSTLDPEVLPQDYRKPLAKAMVEGFPSAEVYDPWADHNDSLNYSDDDSRSVFLRHNDMCRHSDLLIAFVPEASMGTAIEMWEASQGGAKVVAITRMIHNWAIRFTSDLIYPDMESLLVDVQNRTLHRKLGFDADVEEPNK